jgi:hypothetical protein
MNKKKGVMLRFLPLIQAQFEFKICHSQPLITLQPKPQKVKSELKNTPLFFACLQPMIYQ